MLVGLVLATAPEGLPRIELVTVDARAATFAALAGLATLLLFGVAPALSLIRTPIAPTLSGGSREGPVSSVTGQRAIVAAQLALALVLLTGASLFVETLRRLSSEPLGFDPRGVVAIATSFTGNRYGDPATMSRARMSNESFSIDMSRRRTEVIIGIEDRYGQHAAVGSREFEARFFPTGAVGRRFVYRWGTAIGLRNDYEIVGVVENVKRQEFSDDDRPAFYGFDRQGPGVNHFLLRTSEDPRRVLPVVRQTIRDVDPQLVVTGMHLMEGRVARSVAEERFRALLSVAFGATAQPSASTA